MSTASGAVMAKVRTRYGKRLREDDYENLLACKTAGEIANYLKVRTHYGDIFTTTTDVNDITPEVIEFALKKKLSETLERLCAFEKNINDAFFYYFILRSDRDVILNAARNIVSPTEKIYAYMPEQFLRTGSDIDVMKVYNAKSALALVEALKDTRYRRIAKDFVDDYGEFDLPHTEITLYSYFADSVKQLGKKFDKKSRKELCQLIDYEIDVFNISVILRYKAFDATQEHILNNLITEHGTLSKAKLQELIDARERSETAEILRGTKIAKGFTATDFDYIEGAFEENIYKINKRFLRFSINPDISVITFINLSNIEINNITHIVEGKRYNFSKDEIKKFLIGIN